MSSIVNVYACGGAGVNIASFFEAYRNKSEEGFAMVNPIYVDTSRSNMDKSLPEEAIYHIGDLDGGGKIRAENHQAIAENVRSILQTHKPAELNIVLSSAGGGSGSVIAPSLVSELLSRGVPTVVMIIGTSASGIELTNTIRTLKSYESIAELRKTPVIALYYENTKDTPRNKVNSEAHSAIVLLAAYFSKQNKELDSADLGNWLNYCRVTDFPPRLANLHFFEEKVTLEKFATAVSVATLASEAEDISTGEHVEYQCVGYASKETITKFSTKIPVHATILDGVFVQINKRLTGLQAELEQARSARIATTSILSSSDKATSTGLIL
jgi:hypothetical protein